MLTLNKLVKQRYSPRSSKSRQINNPKATPHKKERTSNKWLGLPIKVKWWDNPRSFWNLNEDTTYFKEMFIQLCQKTSLTIWKITFRYIPLLSRKRVRPIYKLSQQSRASGISCQTSWNDCIHHAPSTLWIKIVLSCFCLKQFNTSVVYSNRYCTLWETAVFNWLFS